MNIIAWINKKRKKYLILIISQTKAQLVAPVGILTASGVSVSGIVTATNFVSTSDENLKDNIQTIDHALEKLSEIRGVSFDWKKDQTPSMGVIAQEVEKVFPEVVKTNEYKTVNYNGLIGLLVEAVKELQQRVDILENKDS